MKEPLFRELYAKAETNDVLVFDAAGTPIEVPALISTCTDEKTLMVGGMLNKANYTARCCYSDLLRFITATQGLIGRVISYNETAYRITQSKKHPRSDIVHLTITER